MRATLWIVAMALVLFAGPQTAAAQPPGTLISAQPMAGAPAGGLAWRIRYWTLSDRAAPVEATGVVVAPRTPPPTPRPVIAWTHGASGVVEACAPSRSPNFFGITPGLSDALARGYTVVAPDYVGLGGSAVPHPFLVGVSTARAVLDAVRAARAIPEAAVGARFAVWGESQGGHAALWTGQEARRYAPDLTLVGVAAAAPPTDLVQNLTAGTDPAVRAFLTAFAAYSWSQHFGAPLSTLGNRTTQGVITRLAQNNCVVLDKKPKLGMMLGVLVLRRDLKHVDLGRIQPWARLARENSPSPRDPGVPVLIAQNPGDKIVGANVTQAFARQMCANRVRLRYVTITGTGHETSARDSAGLTLDWIGDRFAGRPAPSNCGRF